MPKETGTRTMVSGGRGSSTSGDRDSGSRSQARRPEMRRDRALVERGDENEISLGLVWRDTSIALSLVIGAFLVETAKDLLFHGHLPLTLSITLLLAETTMCLLALYRVSSIISHLTPLQRLFALSLGYYRNPSPIGPTGWGFPGRSNISHSGCRGSHAVVGFPGSVSIPVICERGVYHRLVGRCDKPGGFKGKGRDVFSVDTDDFRRDSCNALYNSLDAAKSSGRRFYSALLGWNASGLVEEAPPLVQRIQHDYGDLALCFLFVIRIERPKFHSHFPETCALLSGSGPGLRLSVFVPTWTLDLGTGEQILIPARVQISRNLQQPNI